jgi:hypothetical protein
MKQINIIALFILLVMACTNSSKKENSAIHRSKKELQVKVNHNYDIKK